MFSQVSERKMLTVRCALFMLWLVLIASLLWDPVTKGLTDPGNMSSPFRIMAATYTLRGQTHPLAAYNMSNRIFWTMVVPLLPMFLMVFGHEAWRRICPLSFASQLPRYFGFMYTRKNLQRRTGKVEVSKNFVPNGSWLHRNAWYVQLGLLYVGLNARLLILNSNRTALAIALSAIILSAIAIGYRYGGKTWCHYICPVNIVQRIYTEPRGLLESRPHLNASPIPQSMCRTSTPDGDKTVCVGCISNCGDVDLEKSYWESILDPRRRIVYYAFFGLIIGFYGYYSVYAGNAAYYFSGIWTHDGTRLSDMFSPGIFFQGALIHIPKIIVVPVFLGLSGFISVVFCKIVEYAYRTILKLRMSKLSEASIINNCLATSAYISINTFYLFGGRPNLGLMSSEVVTAINILIVALSTIWFSQAIDMSPEKYRVEAAASGTRAKLKAINLRWEEVLQGRSIDDLSATEANILRMTVEATGPKPRSRKSTGSGLGKFA